MGMSERKLQVLANGCNMKRHNPKCLADTLLIRMLLSEVIIIYRRNCTRCGKYYEGRGKEFCSKHCSNTRIYPKKIESIQEIMNRFFDKVQKSDDPIGCWRWTGYRNKKGYGQFRLNGKMVSAHRVAYMLAHSMDSIPEGMCILHNCDNPECTNDDHLYLGTNQDNMYDRDRKGRQSHQSINVGERNGSSKLTEEKVRLIRLRIKKGDAQQVIAKEFDVSQGAISQINQNKHWKYI